MKKCLAIYALYLQKWDNYTDLNSEMPITAKNAYSDQTAQWDFKRVIGASRHQPYSS